jgi:fructose-1,6-bisphosphatase/inositol monophosphatase family enzyme
MTEAAAALLDPIRALHARIRDLVVRTCEKQAIPDLARVEQEGAGDTVYAIDRVGETLLVSFFEEEVARHSPLVLIAEGFSGGRLVLPRGKNEAEARFQIIVDPIDGTRGLMYQKRSGWILTGVAPNRGPATSLADIELAVQTEIPIVKQHLSDVLWAVRGRGAAAERWNRVSGERSPLTLRPSRAATIAHGFATVSRFFPGAREELAAIDEELVREALGPVEPGKAHAFEDQYISSGGQLYELASGHDRFVADLRPLMEPLLARRGLTLGICCHPYDLSTELIARELGVIVTDERGGPLRAPLDVETNVAWVGYANEQIRAQVEPLLKRALTSRGLL